MAIQNETNYETFVGNLPVQCSQAPERQNGLEVIPPGEDDVRQRCYIPPVIENVKGIRTQESNCLLLVNDGTKVYRGTGFLIPDQNKSFDETIQKHFGGRHRIIRRSNYVLTAAHCIPNGGTSILVRIPKRQTYHNTMSRNAQDPNADDGRFEDIKVTNLHENTFKSPVYEQCNLPAADFGLIRLPETVERCIDYLEPWDFNETPVAVSVNGYPGERNPILYFSSSRYTSNGERVQTEFGFKSFKFIDYNSQQFGQGLYTCQTSKGQSGGPVLFNSSETRWRVAGIHTGSGVDEHYLNCCTLITDDVLEWIRTTQAQTVENENAVAVEEWQGVLIEMGVQELIPTFQEEGLTDMNFWSDYTIEDLTDIGFTDALAQKFRNNFQQDNDNWRERLQGMRLPVNKFGPIFEQEGLTNPSVWPNLTNEKLKELGFKGVHIRMWRTTFADGPEPEYSPEMAVVNSETVVVGCVVRLTESIRHSKGIFRKGTQGEVSRVDESKERCFVEFTNNYGVDVRVPVSFAHIAISQAVATVAELV